MTEYEFYNDFNQKVDERNAAFINNQKKHRPLFLLRILIPVFVALLLFVALEKVGFINITFCAILMVITICYGSFKVGQIWHKIKF